MKNTTTRNNILKYVIISVIAILIYLFMTPPMLLWNGLFPGFLVALLFAVVIYKTAGFIISTFKNYFY